MAVRDDRGDEKQTTAGFRGPLMVQSLTSAKSKFLSLVLMFWVLQHEQRIGCIFDATKSMSVEWSPWS